MKPYQRVVSGGFENIRRRRGTALIDGRKYRVEVITHIGGNRWIVQGDKLRIGSPRFWNSWRGFRATVHRNDLTLRAVKS